MPIIALHHVQLAMPEGQEDLARGFYTGLLGLAERSKPASLAGRGGVWFGAQDLQLHLGVEVDFRPAKKAHPALLVHDLPSLLARLRKGGVTPREDGSLPGFRRAYVDDPFGNRIEFLESV